MPQSDPTNTPLGVVFIHGVGGSALAWQRQVESFSAAGYAPLALNLPGYGGRPAVEHIDFEQFSDDVEAQIAAAGLVRPVLVGHSLGGMIAQTMLRRKPEGYQAVVLVGTSPSFGKPDGDFQKKFVADRLAPLRSGKTMPELAAGMINEIMGPNADPDGKAVAIASMASAPAATYQACVEAIVTFEERANLGQIQSADDVPRGRARHQCSARHDAAHGSENSRRHIRDACPASGICQIWKTRPPSTRPCSASCVSLDARQ